MADVSDVVADAVDHIASAVDDDVDAASNVVARVVLVVPVAAPTEDLANAVQCRYCGCRFCCSLASKTMKDGDGVVAAAEDDDVDDDVALDTSMAVSQLLLLIAFENRRWWSDKDDDDGDINDASQHHDDGGNDNGKDNHDNYNDNDNDKNSYHYHDPGEDEANSVVMAAFACLLSLTIAMTYDHANAGDDSNKDNRDTACLNTAQQYGYIMLQRPKQDCAVVCAATALSSQRGVYGECY